MDQRPYGMDRSRRETVLAAMLQRCIDRRWRLLAAHVRSNHVHIVVQGDARPERIMNDLKSYASRCLNALGLDEPHRKRWHGMEVRGGCGTRRMCRQRFDMSSTSRVNQWLSSRR
jgi:REP element-mobilizing transposase RayT